MTLLPNEKGLVRIAIRGDGHRNGVSPRAMLRMLAEEFDAILVPVSQNFAGEPIPYEISRRDRMAIVGSRE